VRVYVAASSSQIDRAKDAMRTLAEAGHEVTSDWTRMIEDRGEANPADASFEERRDWAAEDVRGVAVCDVLWLLMPSDRPSFGAGVEFGFALGDGAIRTVVSGLCEASIFTALADACYDRDDLAFAAEFAHGGVLR
jgi:hypothetical protein